MKNHVLRILIIKETNNNKNDIKDTNCCKLLIFI